MCAGWASTSTRLQLTTSATGSRRPPAPRSGSCDAWSNGTRASGCSSSARTSTRSTVGGPERPKITGQNPSTSERSSIRRSATARSRCSWCRRSRTSRSTCPRHRSPSRSLDGAGRARRRPSASGRLLRRPEQSAHTASFYTLIVRDTVDQDFPQNRQRFLAEQCCAYTILDATGSAPRPEVSPSARRNRARGLRPPRGGRPS
jgi:hypothetical protein